MNFAFIMTCMGRLQHARKAAKCLLDDSRIDGLNHRFVFVDYQCPQNSGEQLKARYQKRIEVLRVPPDRPSYFHKTKAWNLGAKKAKELGCDFFVFYDADFLTTPKLQDHIFWKADLNEFMIILPKKKVDLGGFLAVHSDPFFRVSGYDERMIGWGTEDYDMRLRLYLGANLKPREVPADWCRSIPHGDELRTQHAQRRLQESVRHNNKLLEESMIALTGKNISGLLQSDSKTTIRKLIS